MRSPYRHCCFVALLVLLTGVPAAAVAQGMRHSQPGVSYRQEGSPAPIERRPPSGSSSVPSGSPGSTFSPSAQPPSPFAQGRRGGPDGSPAAMSRSGGGPRGGYHTYPAGHLAEWMSEHHQMPLPQQQQALEREPGFHDLPQATQQRMHARLQQLDAMTPEKRQRLLARNEAMERLSPDQRAQVRGAMQQLGTLPPDQRGIVSRSFRQLRDVPPAQRQQVLDSEPYRNLFNPAQRSTLANLLRVEPMLPPRTAPAR